MALSEMECLAKAQEWDEHATRCLDPLLRNSYMEMAANWRLFARDVASHGDWSRSATADSDKRPETVN